MHENCTAEPANQPAAGYGDAYLRLDPPRVLGERPVEARRGDAAEEEQQARAHEQRGLEQRKEGVEAVGDMHGVREVEPRHVRGDEGFGGAADECVQVGERAALGLGEVDAARRGGHARGALRQHDPGGHNVGDELLYAHAARWRPAASLRTTAWTERGERGRTKSMSGGTMNSTAWRRPLRCAVAARGRL